MEIRTEFGLTVAFATAEEALAADPSALPARVALIRVPSPPEEAWEPLASLGYVRKPAWITWYSETRVTERQWFAGLSGKTRYDIRRARRRADVRLRLSVEQPVRAAHLDAFLALYATMVEGMRYGVSFAPSLRESILDGEEFFAVWAWESGRLVGGCVCVEQPAEETALIRFSAVRADWRRQSLSRVLYAEAVAVARERGHRLITLGNDPNLYGHVPLPGLLEFKARLGFTPVPARPFGVTSWQDEADLLLRLDGLAEPALMLGYLRGESGAAGARDFRLEVFHRAGLDQPAFDLSFVSEIRRHPVVGQRGLDQVEQPGE